MAKNQKQKLMNPADLRKKFSRAPLEYIDSGILAFNDLWGGGVPTGKIIELHSLAGLGKSTLSLQVARSYLKQGKKVAFADVEAALEEPLKEGMKVREYEEQYDSDGNPLFLHVTPQTFKEIEEVFDSFLENKYDLMIYDSLTMTVPDRRKEGSIIDVQPGLKSQLQAVFLEQYKVPVSRIGSSIIILNQMRTHINFFKSTVSPAGGQALQFETDIRTGLKKIEWLEKSDTKERYGVGLEVCTIKNKLSMPFRKVRIDLHFGKGVNNIATLAQALLDKDVCVQSGAYFTVLDSDKAIQGRINFNKWVKQNKENCLKELKGSVSDFLDTPAPEI